MLVTLIKKKHISTLLLPEKINGQYWIEDFNASNDPYQLMSIEARGNSWELKSNRNVKIVSSDKKFIKSVTLESGHSYYIDIAGEPDRSVIYVEPTTLDRQTYTKYYVRPGSRLQIGRAEDRGNEIVYKNGFVSSRHAAISFVDGKWIVEDLGSTNGTFVNERAVTGETFVNPGDVIYIVGMKIIIASDFIAFNNPDGRIQIATNNLKNYIAPSFEEDDEEDVQISETEYFYRSPRFKRDIETAKFKIDPPPADQIGNEMPLMMTIGPSITMGLASVTSGAFSVINAVSNGNIRSAIPTMAMSISMLLGTMLWPIITKNYEKKRKIKREALRQEKYTKYLDDIKQALADESEKQREILRENSIMTKECFERVDKTYRNLWERTSSQNDFLQLRLGLGTLPLQAEIMYQERKFSLDDDNLQEDMYNFCEAPKLLENVPISISLKEDPFTGIIGDRTRVSAFVKGLVLQIASLYGYDEVKCAFIYDKKEEDKFSFVKWLPHVWDDDKTFRLIATNNSELKEVSAFIGREVEKRSEINEKDIDEVKPYYIIFALSKNLALRSDILKQIYSSNKNLNISIVACYDELKNLPKECSTVIDLEEQEGKLYDKDDISGRIVKFYPDTLVYNDMLPVATQLANIHLDLTSGGYTLPKMITFLEMFGVGKVEHLNSLARWKDNDPTKSLETAIGVSTLGDTFMLDLHEKFHGPHGLVAGMTGSGKSEFIITYILSLAVNYHPDEVAFVLIDYKGGGMAKSFENLPHTAGIITNLDGSAVKRALVSIESELVRRQAIFREAGKVAGVNNIDIYKYQKLYRQNIVKEPLPHLFIISDEFAELKTQQPEFMAQLVSAARIGRSLGVHLILATQKPSGVVDDQIWSNSKFRVCLKVQDRSDSVDMIKRPEAAELSDTGRFYLQVGYNELFELGQSAWAGAQYYPSDSVETEKDEMVSVIDRNGRYIKQVKLDKRSASEKNAPKQMDAITDYLCTIAKEENIGVRKIWLEPIPSHIYWEDLKIKYRYRSKRFVLNPLVGEYDDPSNQRQCAFTLPISEEGNIIVYGSAGNGKTTLINAMVHSLITEHSAEEVNIYLLDFASETLRAFTKAPQVGDVVISHESEKIINLFKMLINEVAIRKKLFADFGGDFHSYIANSGKTVPNIVIVINNYTVFKELYEDQIELVSFLSREGSKYGIYFVLTAGAPGVVGYLMQQNFKQQLTMQLNDESEYSSVVGKTDGLYPAKYKGRGLFKADSVYEFQTAYLSEDAVPYSFIQQYSEQMRMLRQEKCARRIPVLPEKVDIEFLKDYYDVNAPLNVPIGVSESSMEVVHCNLSDKCITMIASNDSAQVDFVEALVKMLNMAEVDVKVFDSTRSFVNLNNEQCCFETNEINVGIHRVVEEVLYRNNTYKEALEAGEAVPEFPVKVVVLNSLASLFSELTADENINIKAAMEHCSTLYNMYFVVIDSVKKMVRYSFDKWYANGGFAKDFIWVGNGIGEQSMLTVDPVTNSMRAPIGSIFGYNVVKGRATKIKIAGSYTEEDN